MMTYLNTVIIPTTGTRPELIRAIDSVKGQASIIVVLNGNQYSAKIMTELNVRTDITLYILAEGNVSLARQYGIRNVFTKYFSFLDDDDIYLADKMYTRTAHMELDDTLDVVIGNGYYQPVTGKRTPYFDTMAGFHTDPVISLFKKGNWMTSAGGTFRNTPDICQIFFNVSTVWYEWTTIAFDLRSYRIKFIDDKLFIINETSGSASQSDEYQQYTVRLFDLLLQRPGLTPLIRKTLIEKRADAYHHNKQYLPSISTWYGLKKYFFNFRKFI